jgi:choline/glycine/proline betaine transport protein
LGYAKVLNTVLLIGGGLQALQTATIVTGLPFAMILIVMLKLRRRLQKLKKQESQKNLKIMRK